MDMGKDVVNRNVLDPHEERMVVTDYPQWN